MKNTQIVLTLVVVAYCFESRLSRFIGDLIGVERNVIAEHI